MKLTKSTTDNQYIWSGLTEGHLFTILHVFEKADERSELRHIERDVLYFLYREIGKPRMGTEPRDCGMCKYHTNTATTTLWGQCSHPERDARDFWSRPLSQCWQDALTKEEASL